MIRPEEFTGLVPSTAHLARRLELENRLAKIAAWLRALAEDCGRCNGTGRIPYALECYPMTSDPRYADKNSAHYRRAMQKGERVHPLPLACVGAFDACGACRPLRQLAEIAEVSR